MTSAEVEQIFDALLEHNVLREPIQILRDSELYHKSGALDVESLDALDSLLYQILQDVYVTRSRLQEFREGHK
jgi:hypothetical protein